MCGERNERAAQQTVGSLGRSQMGEVGGLARAS